MKTLARLMTLFVAMTGLATAAHAQTPASIESGDYGDGLLIGVDPVTHTVTGYFYSATGQGQFSCIFYLTGKLGPSKTSVSTYFPETPSEKINGELEAESADKLKIRLSSEHGGCWNVQHFADDSQPAEFALEKKYPWTSVAVIKRERAYFFDTPASTTHRKAYLVQGDGVGVRTIRPGWLQVDFVGGDKNTSGWIKQTDIYLAE